jgi:hypothetical protein
MNAHNKEVANWAQDMVINTILKEHLNKKFAIMPKIALLIPPKYKGKLIYEMVYEWLLENLPKKGKGGGKGEKGKDKRNGDGAGEEEGNGDPYEGKGLLDEHQSDFEKLQKDLEKYGVKDSRLCSPEEAKQIVQDIKNELKARGITPGNSKELLDAIEKSHRNLIAPILTVMADAIGRSIVKRTYQRLNRRNANIKGKKYNQAEINVILDTSGSMSDMDIKRVLGEVVDRGAILNIIETDTTVNKVTRIEKANQIKEVNGRGGTELQSGIDYIKNDKQLKMFPTVILTDGYTDKMNCTGIKTTFVITVGVNPEIVGATKIINLNNV